MRNPKRIWIPSIVLILLLIAIFLIMRSLGITHISREQVDQFQVFIKQLGLWGPLGYIVLSIVATVLLVPATPIILVAGVFGVVWGSIYGCIGLTLGASASFLLARYSLRPYIASWIEKRPSFKKIDEGVRHEGWHMVFFTRYVPIIPFSIQNYAYGLTKVSFGVYFIVTAICLIPPVIAYVFIGGSLVSGEGEIKTIILYITIGGLVLGLLSLVPRLWMRRFSSGAGRKTPDSPPR
ncbi:MAG TPA: TVP38/TMEM64 family protein [Verrucomicrobia bacterium]|nr:TVP38/TMEM64 family protein [Verrucomicrobiota bacterium]